jgi:hypothetical protein
MSTKIRWAGFLIAMCYTDWATGDEDCVYSN